MVFIAGSLPSNSAESQRSQKTWHLPHLTISLENVGPPPSLEYMEAANYNRFSWQLQCCLPGVGLLPEVDNLKGRHHYSESHSPGPHKTLKMTPFE